MGRRALSVRTALSFCLALLTSTRVPAEVERFYGYAYDLASGRYLYTEVHEQHRENGRWRSGSIRSYAADGRLIASKTLDFSAHPYIPVYRFELPAERYVEAITRVDADGVRLEKQVYGKRSSRLLRPDADTAADSGFHSYLVDHLEELQAGETLALRFIVAGQLDVYRFRARRIAEIPFDGQPALRIRVEADSLLRLVAPALELVYQPQSGKLLEYRGISNVHDPASGKAYNARIVFPGQPPPDAPKALPPLETGAEP